LVGNAVTIEQGAFQIEFDESYFQDCFKDRRPDLFFKIFRESKLIKSTEDSVLWNVGAGETKIVIEVSPAIPWPELKIDSFDELMQHEQEILKRIAQVPNGGRLFVIHPFMLFIDINVILSEDARKEIVKREPYLSGASPVTYNALKASKSKQNLRFHIRGLFRRK